MLNNVSYSRPKTNVCVLLCDCPTFLFLVLSNNFCSKFTFVTVNLLQNSRQSEASKNLERISESEQFCAMKYGSYCLWRNEHKEKIKDFVVKRMKDQLYVARAYYPSIAKLPALDKLSLEMKQNIQEYERVLSETSTDIDLPSQ